MDFPLIALTEILSPDEPKDKVSSALMQTFAFVTEDTTPLAVCTSMNFLDGRMAFFSLSVKEDKPIMCNDAPPSTMYVLSVERFVKPFVTVFTCLST